MEAFKNVAITTLLITVAYIDAIGLGKKYIEKSVIIKLKQPLTTSTTPSSTTTVLTTPFPTTIPKNTSNSVIQSGIGCGTRYMSPGEVLRIESSNYNATPGIPTYYPNNYACSWKFFSKECTITAACPCVDIPPTFECIGDYLQIIDPPFYHQKFCGSLQPQGLYRASTELFTLRFRSDKRRVGKGFVCFVQCTAPGDADQLTPVTCP